MTYSEYKNQVIKMDLKLTQMISFTVDEDSKTSY